MTPPATGPRLRDIPALHAAIAPLHQLHEERRALYQLATDLLLGTHTRVLDLDVLDNPLARKRIGDALAGRSSLDCSQLFGIGALADADSAAHGLRVINRPQASTLLAEVLDDVRAELGPQHRRSEPPRLLTEDDGERFRSTLAVLRDGVALARSISPELISDLLPHVELIAILDPRCAGGLASGSSRTVPGLVMIEGSGTSLDVAEALVHEGAHQKLFDLAITHDLLNATSEQCPPFRPPWPPAERHWPLEQTLAACHTYCCLALFEQHAAASGMTTAIGTNSLLPHAHARSVVLGDWLLDKGDYLGADAHKLLQGLLDVPPRTQAQRCSTDKRAAEYTIDTGLQVRRLRSSQRVLVGQPAVPPELYWVSGDAATLLELLRYKPLDEVTDALALRWQLPSIAAKEQLGILLDELCASGLVRPRM